MKFVFVILGVLVAVQFWGRATYADATYCSGWGNCQWTPSHMPPTVPPVEYNSELSSTECTSIVYLCADEYVVITDQPTGVWRARLKTCESGKCAPGYTQTTATAIQPDGCNIVSVREESDLRVPYITCVPACTKTASDCKTTDFTAYTTGKERRVKTSTLNTTTCTCQNTYEYRCAAGYWGNPGTNGSGTCTKCDSFTDFAGTVHTGTSVAGSNTAQSSCYIPKNTPIDGIEGTFFYNANCSL